MAFAGKCHVELSEMFYGNYTGNPWKIIEMSMIILIALQITDLSFFKLCFKFRALLFFFLSFRKFNAYIHCFYMIL